MAELVWRINARVDNASENRTTLSNKTAVMYLGPGSNYQFAAFRFTTPVTGYTAILSDLVGAVVTDARIQYRAGATDSGGGWTLEWIVEAANSPADYTSSAKISTRSYVNWTHQTTGKGTGTGSVDQTSAEFGNWLLGSMYESKNLASLIQQWINAGYPATATSLAVAAHAWTYTSANNRQPTSYDGAGGTVAYYPHIHITYTTAGGQNVPMSTPPHTHYTGLTPTVTGDGQRDMSAPSPIYITSLAPTSRGDALVAMPATSAVTVTANAPTFTAPRRLDMPAPPVVHLWGQVPTVTIAGGSALLVPMPTPTAVTVSGQTPTLTAGGTLVSLTVPSVYVSGLAPTFATETTVAMPEPPEITVASFTPQRQMGGVTVRPLTPQVFVSGLQPTVTGAAGGEGFVQFGTIQRTIDARKIPVGANVYFEAVIRAATANKTARARPKADGAVVQTVEIASTTPTRVRSVPFSLSGLHTYTVEFGGTAGDLYYCYAADVIVKKS